MKDLEEIKDEVAQKSYGCDHWDEFYIENKEYPKELSAAFEEVVRKCVHQALDEAAEKVEEKVVSYGFLRSMEHTHKHYAMMEAKEILLSLKEKY